MSRVGKSGFYGFYRTQFFSDSPPNLYCFPPNSYHFYKMLYFFFNLLNFTKIFPNFNKVYNIFTKFVMYAVLSQFQIVVIYTFFPPYPYPQKVRVDNKITFSNSGCVGPILEHIGAYWIMWDHLGPFGTIHDDFGQFWTILDYIGLVGTSLDLFGHLLDNVGPF